MVTPADNVNLVDFSHSTRAPQGDPPVQVRT